MPRSRDLRYVRGDRLLQKDFKVLITLKAISLDHPYRVSQPVCYTKDSHAGEWARMNKMYRK